MRSIVSAQSAAPQPPLDEGNPAWQGYRFLVLLTVAVVFVSLVVVNVALSVVATNYINVVLPLIGSVAGVVYLYRPSVKARFVVPDNKTSEQPGQAAVGDAATV